MLELNHIIKGEDLLSGSVAPQLNVAGSNGPSTVFDLKAGGLFKVDKQQHRQSSALFFGG